MMRQRGTKGTAVFLPITVNSLGAAIFLLL